MILLKQRMWTWPAPQILGGLNICSGLDSSQELENYKVVVELKL